MTKEERPEENVLPLVTVVVVSYNGGSHVDKCLDSVLRTMYPNLEIILVDNASTDKSANHEIIRSRFPSVRVVRTVRNLGTLAYNVGASLANGEFVAFLHVDQTVSPGWIMELVRVMMRDGSIGVAQSKVLFSSNPSVLDSAGCFVDILGHSIQRGYNEKDSGQYDKVEEIFFAKNAGMLVRRSLIKRVGLYDPKFFMWNEEADFGWRVWLSGYRVVFVPSSVTYHDVYGKGSRAFPPSFASFHMTKNRISMLVKNYDFRYLPLVVSCSFAFISGVAMLFALTGKARRAIGYFRGMLWVLCNFRAVWQDRIHVQLQVRRVVNSKFLFKKKLIRRLDIRMLRSLA